MVWYGIITNERRASLALHVESSGLRIYICHDWISNSTSLSLWMDLFIVWSSRKNKWVAVKRYVK